MTNEQLQIEVRSPDNELPFVIFHWSLVISLISSSRAIRAAIFLSLPAWRCYRIAAAASFTPLVEHVGCQSCEEDEEPQGHSPEKNWSSLCERSALLFEAVRHRQRIPPRRRPKTQPPLLRAGATATGKMASTPAN